MTIGPDEEDNPIFGQFLCDLRTSKRLSRAEAARRIYVSSEYIRLIERGERSPALGTAIKMFDIYGLPYIQERSHLHFENTSVNFVSRIKEARHKDSKIPTSRDEMIGQIVKFLVVVDDDTLNKIYSELESR